MTPLESVLEQVENRRYGNITAQSEAADPSAEDRSDQTGRSTREGACRRVAALRRLLSSSAVRHPRPSPEAAHSIVRRHCRFPRRLLNGLSGGVKPPSQPSLDVSGLVRSSRGGHIREGVAADAGTRFDGELEFLSWTAVCGWHESILEQLARKIAYPRARQPRQELVSGINRGLREARGRFIVRMDAHSYIAGLTSGGWLERLERAVPGSAPSTQQRSPVVAAHRTRLDSGSAPAARRSGQAARRRGLRIDSTRAFEESEARHATSHGGFSDEGGAGTRTRSCGAHPRERCGSLLPSSRHATFPVQPEGAAVQYGRTLIRSKPVCAHRRACAGRTYYPGCRATVRPRYWRRNRAALARRGSRIRGGGVVGERQGARAEAPVTRWAAARVRDPASPGERIPRRRARFGLARASRECQRSGRG